MPVRQDHSERAAVEWESTVGMRTLRIPMWPAVQGDLLGGGCGRGEDVSGVTGGRVAKDGRGECPMRLPRRIPDRSCLGIWWSVLLVGMRRPSAVNSAELLRKLT